MIHTPSYQLPEGVVAHTAGARVTEVTDTRHPPDLAVAGPRLPLISTPAHPSRTHHRTRGGRAHVKVWEDVDLHDECVAEHRVKEKCSDSGHGA